MLIKKLILCNFRQYKGVQKIEFSTDKEKNVTVLIGVNTSGKTTFIRAFEWILYGKKGFDDSILLNKNIADNLQMGESESVWGKLLIEHNGTEYEIEREEKYISTGSFIKIDGMEAKISYLEDDGQTKTKIESDFETNIESILPSALSSYFFFGGERLGTISSRSDIEDSVKGLMGLDVLYNARNHMKKVINHFNKNMDFSGNQDAKIIQSKLDATQMRIEEYKKELENVSEQLEYYQAEKEKYGALLRANQSTKEKQRKREQLEVVVESLKNKIETDKDQLVKTFSKNSFAFFSLPLLKNAIQMLENYSDDVECVPEMSGDAIDYIIKRGICICGTCISEGSAAEKNLLAEKVKQPPESIGSVARRYREQAFDYISSYEDYYDNMEEGFRILREDQRELGFREDEQIKLYEELKNLKDVSKLEQNYQNAIKKIAFFEKSKETNLETIGALRRDIENYETALKNYYVANEKNVRTSLKIAYAKNIHDWVDEAYRKRENTVRTELEKKVNYNFSCMYHGSRTIAIDEKYRVKYVDVTTEESDGLKAVKSFAFISGLVDLAKEALTSENSSEADVGPQYYPLVIDAPFSNVDELHIKNISKVIPKSAEQVIIAVMEKDWEPASEILGPVVGKSYFIEKYKDKDNNEIDTITHIVPCKRGVL